MKRVLFYVMDIVTFHDGSSLLMKRPGQFDAMLCIADADADADADGPLLRWRKVK